MEQSSEHVNTPVTSVSQNQTLSSQAEKTTEPPSSEAEKAVVTPSSQK